MPKPLTYALLALALTACTALAPDVIKIEGVPSYAPAAFPPEVLEQLPSRAHVTIGIVDAKGAPGMTASQLLASIREQAQKLGADAVILQDASVRAPAESKFNPATGGYTVVPGQPIPAFKGTAIKYR
jgi:hypothetical protein